MVYWESAAGTGKSPILAALGLYELIAGGEPGQQIYCVASNYQQARVVFDAAKLMIGFSLELSCRLKITQYEISYAATNSVWRIISGRGPKSGARPGMALGDEVHEWPTREVYDAVQGRMLKRGQPLFICATNAAADRTGLCFQLHEEAVAVLRGEKHVPNLYPVIWAADPAAGIHDEAAWKEANPLLGSLSRSTSCARKRPGPTAIPS